jgi:hypothetical protein
MVGPSTTWICRDMASSASSVPTSYALSWFHAAASSDALGNSVTGRPPAKLQPANAGRTVGQAHLAQPDGRFRSEGEPTGSVSSKTFVSRSSDPIIAS